MTVSAKKKRALKNAHVAGPWETEPEGTAEWRVQRCLFCDELLIRELGPPVAAGFSLGEQVTVGARPCPR